MKISTQILLGLLCLIVVILAIAIPDWHFKPADGVQIGSDGLGMEQLASDSPWHLPPPPKTAEVPASAGGASAAAAYKNMKVETDLSAAQFLREHRAMTGWVSPKQGCAFCHTAQDYASDKNPMKTVARTMMQMTRVLNTKWKSHVGAQGVTCYSCHRGDPLPPETWFPSRSAASHPAIAKTENWDDTAVTVRGFFPDNGWSLYLLNDEPIRVESTTALKSGTVAPELAAKRVYEMMMQMSNDIGANCGLCHNSRAFQDWSQSGPERWNGYSGIQMTRDINRAFLFPMKDVMAQTREYLTQNDLAVSPDERGPKPGAGLAVCGTCHYGHLVPQVGTADIAHYGALASTASATAAAPAPKGP